MKEMFNKAIRFFTHPAPEPLEFDSEGLAVDMAYMLRASELFTKLESHNKLMNILHTTHRDIYRSLHELRRIATEPTDHHCQDIPYRIRIVADEYVLRPMPLTYMYLQLVTYKFSKEELRYASELDNALENNQPLEKAIQSARKMDEHVA